MPKEIKLFVLSKKLNVGIGSLKDSLERRSFPNIESVNPNTKVSLDLATQLVQEHGKHLGKERVDAILAELTSPAPAKAATEETKTTKEAPEKKPKVTPPKTVALPWRLGGDTTDMPTPDSTSSSRPVEQ